MVKEEDAHIRFFFEHLSREGLKRVEESGNPLYLWETIEEFAGLSGLYRKPRKNPHAMTALSNWVVWCLLVMAEELLAMGRGHARTSKADPRDVPAAGDETITPAQALAEVPRVLRLVKPGRNAFAAMRRDQLRENAVCSANFGSERADLRKYLGIKTDRALSRELSSGRRSLRWNLRPDWEPPHRQGVKKDRSLRDEPAKQRKKPLSHNGSCVNGRKRN
jgi:hypothetical protein